MSDPAAHVVVLAAGHGGGTAAALLRRYGFEGAINSPPEFMVGRQFIGARRPVDKAKLADPTVSMRDVAA
jgi:hypothetical protein